MTKLKLGKPPVTEPVTIEGGPTVSVEPLVPPVDQVNLMMKEVILREFVVTAPGTGQFVDVVRVDDVLAILCQHFGVDPKVTQYSAYT